MNKLLILGMTAVLACAAASGHAQGFKFSQDDNGAKGKEQARQEAIADRLSTPCREQLKSKKIMLIIGEQMSAGGILANQENYGPALRRTFL